MHEGALYVPTLKCDIIVGGADSARGEDVVIGTGKPPHLFSNSITVISHHCHLDRDITMSTASTAHECTSVD